MVDYAEALTYPSRNWTNVIIGGIMTMISMFILPAFLLLGYLVEVARNTIEGKAEQPKWENWGKLFTNGLSVFVILVVYLIVPTLVLALGIMIAAPEIIPMVMTFDYSAISYIMTSLMFSAGIYVLLAMLLFLIIGFVLPMALANYAAKGRISAAFAFGELWARINSIFSDYILAYLVIIFVSMLFSAVSGMLVMTVVVPLFIMFYYQVFVWRVQGMLYKASKA